MINIVYFGTHEFSATVLEYLIQSREFNIQKVITQPDRPVGRKQELQKSPVKLIAEKHNLETKEPESLKNYQLETRGLDLNIVCQYGLIIPESIIETPKFKTLNVHTSRLPKYRGASPIQGALIAGEVETANTIMLVDKKMDHGPILAEEAIKIAPDDTYLTLSEKMSKLAGPLLVKTALNWVNGKITPIIQDDNDATYCKLLTREDGKIDFQKSANDIYNLYRGLTPWPGIWTMWNNLRLKLLQIKPVDRAIPWGQIVWDNNKLLVGTSKKALEITELQLEGKKPMDAKSFVNGYKDFIGSILK
ncbi:MAG TPA: methionyl-tRNA formyltransferase [Patescibacteria group bacterium]|nr:methionyl-tRNA formyltransferase [Patescibacteria group bacterium]